MRKRTINKVLLSDGMSLHMMYSYRPLEAYATAEIICKERGEDLEDLIFEEDMKSVAYGTSVAID